MAAAKATLQELQKIDAANLMTQIGSTLNQGLVNIASTHGYKLIASGIPAMPYYRLDGVSYETHVAWIDECVKRGVYLLGYHNHFISTAHTETDIQLTLEIVDEAFSALGPLSAHAPHEAKIVIAGYCWPQSGEHSESIDLFCHTTANTFNIEVVRQGAQDKTVLTQANITGIAQDVSGDIAVEGSRWRGGFKLTIAPEWRSGFYLVRLEDADGNKAQAFFVVRSSECADATLVLATSTWNAYNHLGWCQLLHGRSRHFSYAPPSARVP